ncbi:hypothetical protein [Neoroseomonas lacus]|uniref:Uncharacterized protein n=1 Tax=Neoroseomonas lacus TaxID=287609 RepID=A0A917KQF0_9PROT|nr:hypothetical protein [Neoroseomonas lacus]GGJ21932.1 hypothetical protein GCM10011320_31450 [Neoroseomonas lacus]
MSNKQVEGQTGRQVGYLSEHDDFALPDSFRVLSALAYARALPFGTGLGLTLIWEGNGWSLNDDLGSLALYLLNMPVED